MNEVIGFILDIVKAPAFLVALIALIGLALLRKPAPDMIKGTLKTFVGFLVLSGGAGIVTDALEPLGGMFQAGFNIRGIVPNNEAIVSVALQQYGSTTALIMFFGMLVNILIARFTSFKHIFLTGHHTLYMAAMLAVIFTVAGFTDFGLIAVGALALGLVMSLSPFILQKYMREMTGSDGVGLGHFGGGGYWMAGFTGRMLNRSRAKVHSTEDVNFPKGLAFLRDSTVAIALTMMIVYLIVAFAAGQGYITENYPDGGNLVVFALTKGGQFAAGVYVILQGVRLVLNEIVPAFKGISEKLVPNSIPALDCPIVYTFAPNAVLIGFLSSFAGGLVSMAIMAFTGLPVVIPGVVPHFFCGATAGVFGNATGGLKGSVAGSFIQGIAISFLPIALMPVLGSLGFANTTFSDFDFTIMGIVFGGLGANAGQIGIIAGLAISFALMIGYSIVTKGRSNKAAVEEASVAK
ncbi:MAG: PTS ascorbate transporter subunit IIC [Micropruina sp.]|uniref:PTS ascorbate transporter subunit IIC n=1 Tax=Micropruina sp. TaxID=2737536 RepID=UPI0039E5248A